MHLDRQGRECFLTFCRGCLQILVGLISSSNMPRLQDENVVIDPQSPEVSPTYITGPICCLLISFPVPCWIHERVDTKSPMSRHPTNCAQIRGKTCCPGNVAMYFRPSRIRTPRIEQGVMSAGISVEACGRAVTGIEGAGVGVEGASRGTGRMIPSSISKDDEDDRGEE